MAEIPTNILLKLMKTVWAEARENLQAKLAKPVFFTVNNKMIFWVIQL